MDVSRGCGVIGMDPETKEVGGMKSVILEVDCAYVCLRVPAFIDGRKVITDIDILYKFLYDISGSNWRRGGRGGSRGRRL